jgi:murein tripeptide amidase MpaA
MYLNVNEVETALTLAAAAPYDGFTQLIPLPNLTWEGRQCHAVKIGRGQSANRPAVYFLGGVHAREWGSADILITFITQLQNAYNLGIGVTFGARVFTVGEIQDIVDTLDIIVFPQANPDGRQYSMTVDANWRKNRRITWPNDVVCPGVDINRNYDFLWDFGRYFSPLSMVMTSSSPCDYEAYCGPAAFSEPETMNCRWIFDQFPNIGAFIDVHSWGEDILYSWGDDESQAADPAMNFQNAMYDGQRGMKMDAYQEYLPGGDAARAVALANTLKNAIQDVRGTAYTVKPSFAMYPTSGASDDYAYSRHFVDPNWNKVLAYTLEWGTQPHTPYSEMTNIISEVTCGLFAFVLDICNKENAMAWQTNGNGATNPLSNFLGTTDKEPVVIKTNGAEVLRITEAGKVGIGTAAPSAGLEIEKGATNDHALHLRSSGPGWGSGLQLINTGPGAKTFGIYSGQDGILHFADVDNSVDRLVITKDGKVGIGTTAPSAGLEIEKGATNDHALHLRSSGPGWGSGLQLINTGPGAKTFGIYSGHEGILHFADVDNSVDRLLITKDGNIGIGTIAPNNKLTIISDSSQHAAALVQNSAGFLALGALANGDVPSIAGVGMGAAAGVQGHAVQTTGTSFGVVGTVGGAEPPNIEVEFNGGAGVLGQSDGGIGVVGFSSTGAGMSGFTDSIGNGCEGSVASGQGAGVHGSTPDSDAVAVFGWNSGGGQAGRFLGDVQVSGTLTSSNKGFRIDHPLDPDRKYLIHSSVESPDMLTVYSGVITTGDDGEATVELPSYFEALNRDFRYQLTVIREFAQAIVSREVENNTFVIRTDRPRVKVSWQVTGVRRDRYAEAHRLPVEEEKPDGDRGRHLHPDLYAIPGRDRMRPIGQIDSTFRGIVRKRPLEKIFG